MNDERERRGKYEVSVKRQFAAAHAIRLYDGTLEPVHGHNWTVELSVAMADGGIDAIEVVVDFHALEKILDGLIATAHNGHLNTIRPFVGDADNAEHVCGLAINPTAERVAWWLATEVDRRLPADGARVVSCSVGEAPGCVATYRMGF